jgi:hypothetical protein
LGCPRCAAFLAVPDGESEHDDDDGATVWSADENGDALASVSTGPDELPAQAVVESLPAGVDTMPLDWDDWALADELAHSAQLLQLVPIWNRWQRIDEMAVATTAAAAGPSGPTTTGGMFHEPLSGWHVGRLTPRADHVATPSTTEVPLDRTRGPVASWALLLLGTMALVCGGVLLGWAVVTGRTGLWNLGMPISLAGQAALLIGLALAVERMWRRNRPDGCFLPSSTQPRGGAHPAVHRQDRLRPSTVGLAGEMWTPASLTGRPETFRGGM